MDGLPVPIGRRRAFRVILALAAAALVSLPVGRAVLATHALGTLDCGAFGTFAVDSGSELPPAFEAPGPWSGLFLLEGTTQVFRALTIEGSAVPLARPNSAKLPRTIITCTLTSTGPMFPTPWTLTGVLIP